MVSMLKNSFYRFNRWLDNNWDTKANIRNKILSKLGI